MKLLYGTTTELVVTVTTLYYESRYRLYFAEDFNMWPRNPPSSDPFRLFIDYREMVLTNDLGNLKYIGHIRAVKSGIRTRLRDRMYRNVALELVNRMGILAIQPYLAILEVDTYLQQHYPGGEKTLDDFRVPPSAAGSPTSVEYVFDGIRGPRHPDAELHLQKLF
jgi:hypothetical protein